MKEVTWLVRMKAAPAAARYCKKCGEKRAFSPSGLFRVNAQQKYLDIWLIYKCSWCDATWNLTVFSRVNPQTIAPGMLRGFHENDAALALRYAADTALLKRNGAMPVMPELEVIGEPIDIFEQVRLYIIPKYPMDVKVSSILRAQMGLSRSEFERLCEEGSIRPEVGTNLKKCTLSRRIRIDIG